MPYNTSAAMQFKLFSAMEATRILFKIDLFAEDFKNFTQKHTSGADLKGMRRVINAVHS